ncbi:molybdenum cofactor guanylyltransferase [Spirochaeta isovalerica]|uniref:Probable molybdenum cofactor guanylyltransferase n=1 Tax=Spirochaeta isovalerica TaxID=150 RepID=A0A841R9B5_9SPIO|nr:molybdenum cofactor guanylyltransferase [Spirochaeta isovalerica]MBB6479539.1 molybdopterin-guanine dinucleotide biosynthesis protein A [Spirochaeta isovalerica]
MNGAVLAGGKSSRMNFRDKSTLLFNGVTFLELIVSRLERFSKVLVISNNSTSADFPRIEADFYRDIIPGIGPLGGIYTALTHSDEEQVFFTTCDMPLICEEVISPIAEAGVEYDVIVPVHNGRYEMLFAVYSRNCLPRIKEMIAAKRYKITGIFEDESLRVKKVTVDETFMAYLKNINTPEEYGTLSSRKR